MELDEDCLKDRKWWCFLLSSIFTFIMGILSVLVVRAFASLFCRKVKVIWNTLCSGYLKFQNMWAGKNKLFREQGGYGYWDYWDTCMTWNIKRKSLITQNGCPLSVIVKEYFIFTISHTKYLYSPIVIFTKHIILSALILCT